VLGQVLDNELLKELPTIILNSSSIKTVTEDGYLNPAEAWSRVSRLGYSGEILLSQLTTHEAATQGYS